MAVDAAHRSDAGGPPTSDLVWALPDQSVVREQIARDLNHDGWLDRTILIAPGADAAHDASAQIRVYLSSADGSLRLATTIAPPCLVDPVDMDLRDVNGDGEVDLLLADPAGGALVVTLGSPRFGFDAASTNAFVVEPATHTVRQCVESLAQTTAPTPAWLDRLRHQLAEQEGG